MKTARFEFDELPFQTLARFGLTQEMIEDLPMRVLDELCEGRHSPVLPVRVSDENGKTVESRTRLVFYRMENGQVDVLFYPVLKNPRRWTAMTGSSRNSYLRAKRSSRTPRRKTDGTRRLSCRSTPRRNR